MNESIFRLEYLCNLVPELLKNIPEHDFSNKPAPNKWSRKEILGHLIDSATNNHQRFVRVQFEDTPFIVYEQDKWNINSRYQNMESAHVIAFWEAYNRHLIEVIKRIPEEYYLRTCKTNEAEPVTLLWLVEDYVKHMEYHLRQIVDY